MQPYKLLEAALGLGLKPSTEYGFHELIRLHYAVTHMTNSK